MTEHKDVNPCMSVRHVAQELGNKLEMVCTTLKKEEYFPYRISMLHELKLEVYTLHYNY